MDIMTVFGLLFGVGTILLGQWMEGGHASSILGGPAAVIVVGGTFGAVFVGVTVKDAFTSFKLATWVIKNPKIVEAGEMITLLTDMARIARRDGLLALDDKVADIDNQFVKTAVRHLVDGVDAAVLREILEADMGRREEEMGVAVKFWEAAGGYAPTIGIIGAVLGLIHTMQNLDDPSKIGGGIAAAFVATVYGVAIANLVFLPTASKLKRKIHKVIEADEMAMEGILAVQAGHNAHIIQARLAMYLDGKKPAGDAAEADGAGQPAAEAA